MTFNVEAFIKEHTRDYHGGDKVVCPPDALRALAAQLAPAGHVVVPRERLEWTLRALQRVLPQTRGAIVTGDVEDAIRYMQEAISTLPASSGAKQPAAQERKCGECGYLRPRLHLHICGGQYGHARVLARNIPIDRLGDSFDQETAYYYRQFLIAEDAACHTPAPAAKEVNNGR